jgi:hypothetical protein
MAQDDRGGEVKRLIGWDVESFLIGPGVAYPQLVCVTWDDGENTGILLDQDGVEWFREQLKDPDVVLTSHNANYDILVNLAEDDTLITLIRLALLDSRLRCTKVREKIIQNASGELKFEWDEEEQSWIKNPSFALQRLVWKHFQIFLKKEEDTWRLRYGHLFRVPLTAWPSEAIEYAINDATWHRKLFLKQDEICENEEIPGEMHVTRTSIALGCLRSWGVRTDEESVAKLEKEITAEYEFWVAKAQETGLVRRNAKRSKDMKMIKDRVATIYAKHSLAIPMTPKKNVCTDREVLTFAGAESRKVPRKETLEGPDGKNVVCVDVALKCVSEVTRTQKLLTTYVKVLKQGVTIPLTPDYNEMVETYRTACSKPNLQNQGRGGGIRRCFKPREGWVYAFCDYDSLEMRTLAQTCIDLFGYSFIAEAIKEGKDLHVDLATETLGGMDYDEAMKRYADGDKIIEEVRQGSKIGNYGMAGGMGTDAFVDYARGYGVEMTHAEAVKIHQAFRRKWREVVDYFNYCSTLCDGSEAEQAVHPRTNMVRGKVRYTALCNYFFQSLAAVGATEALWNVVMETLDPTLKSPLYGCRAWYFGHDEIGLEIPYAIIGPERAHAAAMRLQKVMIESMQKWVPDVPIGATVNMCRRWLKGCKPTLMGGLLVPARQEGKKWVADIDGLPGWERRAA